MKKSEKTRKGGSDVRQKFSGDLVSWVHMGISRKHSKFEVDRSKIPRDRAVLRFWDYLDGHFLYKLLEDGPKSMILMVFHGFSSFFFVWSCRGCSQEVLRSSERFWEVLDGSGWP